MASTSNERLASVVGRAVIDKDFAGKLEKDPKAAAQSIGVFLTPEDVEALREINGKKLTEVAGGLRTVLGPKAYFDQEQHQQQSGVL